MKKFEIRIGFIFIITKTAINRDKMSSMLNKLSTFVKVFKHFINYDRIEKLENFLKNEKN
jgi:hypothetical protein